MQQINAEGLQHQKDPGLLIAALVRWLVIAFDFDLVQEGRRGGWLKGIQMIGGMGCLILY